MEHGGTASRPWLVGLLLVVAVAVTTAQNPAAPIGGAFGALHPRQQELLGRWAADYSTILGRPLDAAQVYDALPLSVRTTFEAVTHALLNSRLTTQDGKSLGTALDLVDEIERVAGQVPGSRGDQQFRVYVYLAPEALNKLYAAKEFERGHDNTVYHIGYPINFRQQGGVPSIQVSVARTGKRADIDVDYRSSAGLAALYSGHLTSANSDVRAGLNQVTHTRRWDGLSNWWEQLMATFVDSPAPEEATDGLAPGKAAERRRIARGPIDAAVYNYLTDWLIQRRPEDLLPFFSVKAYPCIAEFTDDSQPDSRLALARILRRLQDRNRQLGNVSALADVVSPVAYPLPGAVHPDHAHKNLFSLQQVPDDVAWALDCRNRYGLQLAESIPRPPHRLGDTYVVSMRIKDPAEPQSFVVQVWQREGGEWRLVSFDIKRKSFTPPADLLASAGALPAASADERRLVEDADALFSAWLLRKQPSEAAKYFAPDAAACGGPEGLASFLRQAADAAIPASQLEGVMASVPVGHPDLAPIAHRHRAAFVLARVSGELRSTSACGASRSKTERPTTSPLASAATIFTLVSADRSDERPVVTLYWQQTPQGWRVASYAVAAD